MTESHIDLLKLISTNPDALNIPSGLLTKSGPQNYTGSVPAVSGTLFFNDAHLPAVREAICTCFDAFIRIAPPLTWLFREDPPDGPDKMAFANAKPLKSMLAKMHEDDALSFHYTSGKKMQEAGPWEFHVVGVPGWQVKMGDWGLCGLRLSVPLSFIEQHPGAFQTLYVDMARHLRAVHGYAGYSLVLSPMSYDENQAFEAFLASSLRGFDAGHLVAAAANAHLGIKTVGWLTAINYDYLEKIGGEAAVRSELPMDWFRLLDYEAGIVIQAGPKPDAAPVNEPLPATLVLPAMFLQPIRTPIVRMHYASSTSEPRLIGHAAEEWLKRFDVPASDIMMYKERLLAEPKLSVQPGSN